MLFIRKNVNASIIAAVVITSTTAVVAYRPSTYTNAPTSLTYNGGVTTTTSAAAATDTAVANYIRKRYGTSTIDGGLGLSNIYSSPTMTTAVESSSKGALIATTTEDAVQLHRNKWGVDNQYANEYWFDKRIHTLGNHGFWGAVHAAMAPISTKVIDMAAYDGIDIRKELSNELSQMIIGNNSNNNKVNPRNGFRVVDLCCGVGFSTRALRDAFPQPETTVIGVDTSPEMVAMAEFITNHISTVSVSAKKQYNAMKRRGQDIMEKSQVACVKTNQMIRNNSIEFILRNAEDTKLPNKSYDLVTVMYAFHEAPHNGRNKILKEARRLLSPGGILAVVDISTEYTPSPTMLQGEPYVQEYQRNIHRQLANIQGFERPKYRDIVPHHLGMWTLKRSVMA